MRIWKGKEVEHNGNFGQMTLFVESICPDLDIVATVLKGNPDIKTIYFGAGEVSVKLWSWAYDLPKFKENYTILIECSNKRPVPNEVSQFFDTIICRTKLYYDEPVNYVKKLQIKVREDDKVYIAPANKFEFTDITCVAKGQYNIDLELYNDNEEDE